MPKIYGWNNGGREGWWTAVAMAEDGIVLATHLCSHENFMPGDLGMNGVSENKHDLYRAHYPNGFETEFVWSYDFHQHEGLKQAIAKNQELVKAQEVKDENT